jgi:hypothetical protein
LASYHQIGCHARGRIHEFMCNLHGKVCQGSCTHIRAHFLHEWSRSRALP